jgi:hypothetical protein
MGTLDILINEFRKFCIRIRSKATITITINKPYEQVFNDNSNLFNLTVIKFPNKFILTTDEELINASQNKSK